MDFNIPSDLIKSDNIKKIFARELIYYRKCEFFGSSLLENWEKSKKRSEKKLKKIMTRIEIKQIIELVKSAKIPCSVHEQRELFSL